MILLLHGWSFTASFWDRVCGRLKDLPVAVADLGYGGKPFFPEISSASGPLFCVGHSAGFLGLLQQIRQQRFKARELAAINGFTRFTAMPGFEEGVKKRVLQRMQQALAENPAAVIKAFQEKCGLNNGQNGGLPHLMPDPVALAEGLQSLAEGDERQTLQNFIATGGKVSVLAAQQDPIVSHALTKASFPGLSVTWTEGEKSGHLLPLSDPGQVAIFIRQRWENLVNRDR